MDFFPNDFNVAVDEILREPAIHENAATFCLIDQRTTECHWSTLEKLARHKKEGRKIELFYFLGVGWLHRALYATINREPVDAWWGGGDWDFLKQKTKRDLSAEFCTRFQQELGYASVMGWEIYGREAGQGQLMYCMIHATDHPEAPKLMYRAYKYAVAPLETQEQLELELKVSDAESQSGS